ncbi:MAG: leucine-rich repeat domain-containing protein, partial [Clostridia bacterium]|nr:leucine-rich repeat domain-containing protein [Clostridia bacterium]
MKKHFFLRTLCLVLSLLLLALPLASCGGEDTPSGGSGQGGSGTVGGSGDGSGDAHTHTLTAVDEIAPTCEKEGVKAHYHCNGCNKDFLDAAGKQETNAAGLTLSRVSHDYKDGFCRYCDQADPSDRTLSDATRLTSVSVTQNGLISFSKLKVASKYVLTLTLADGERKFEITKEKAAFSLADLPEGAKLSYGRNAMTITVYEREEIEIEGEKGYQDVPLWSGKYALVSLREGYEVLPLRYEDDLISLEGFYGEKRTGNSGEYLLSEVTLPENNKKIYPTLKKDLKVKKAGYTAVIYQTAQGREEGTGQISIFTTPLSDTKQYYYVRVFDENNQPAGDYDLVLRGVTYLQVEMAVETSEKDAEGDRLYQFDYKINSLNNIRFLQGDYMDLSPLFEKIPEGYFLRDNNWNLYEPGKDYLLSSDARGVQEFFAAPAETLRAEAAELALYTDLFQLTRTKWQKNGVPDGNYLFGFSLRLKEDHAYGDLRVPAKILGNRVLLSASSFSWLTVTRVVLEPGFTQLPEKLFFYTEGLTYVAIPASVTSVGDFMFPKEQAGKLKIYCEGRISSDSQWNQVSGTYDFFPTYYNQAGVCSAAEVGDYILRLEDEKLIVTGLKNTNPGPLPEKAKIGVREYPVTGFADNSLSALTAFEIPAFITEMNFAAFGSGLETLTAAEGNPIYSAFGNLLFNKEATEVLFIPQSVTELTFPLTFTEIGESAFENNKAITAVTLPAGCTTIGKNAFNGCTALQSVTLNNALTEIGENAFRGCTALAGVTFGNALTEIGAYAFSGCRSLTHVTLGEALTGIGVHAFENCTTLSEISIPASLSAIGSYVFSGCTALQSVTFREGLESIGSYAFSGCKALSELSFPASLKQVGAYAFSNCNNLGNIAFSEGLESIGQYAFSACCALPELVFPDSLQRIGDFAFGDCSSLRRVIFGTGVSGYTLDNVSYIFSYCHRLVEIINPTSSRLGSLSTVLGVYSSKNEPTHIRRVGDYLFFEGENEYCLIDYVGSETVLNLPESYQGHTYKIAAYAFEGRNLVTDITISDGVTEITEYAFNELGALKTVALGNGVKRVRENAFRACYKLTTVALGNSVTRIEKEAFYSCTKLATFTGGDSL